MDRPPGRQRIVLTDEVAGDPLIHFIDRGANTEVATFPDEPFSSYFSGNTVQICPVGVILPKRRGFAIPIGQRRFDAKPVSEQGEGEPP